MVDEPLGQTLAATRLWKALVSPHHDVSDAERATPRRTPGSRSGEPHRLTRRPTGRQAAQLVGLTAALAAAAGTGAVALNSSPSGAATSATSAQQNALSAARIERGQQTSRDGPRPGLTLEATRKAQRPSRRAARRPAGRERDADPAPCPRARRGQGSRRQEGRRAGRALPPRPPRSPRPRPRTRRRQGAPKVVLPTTGYHLTARFGQAGGRWANNHTGLDFAAPHGTPVRSVMAGEVIQAAYAGAYGRQVKVRHADGTVTSYSHMSEFDVSVGDTVDRRRAGRRHRHDRQHHRPAPPLRGPARRRLPDRPGALAPRPRRQPVVPRTSPHTSSVGRTVAVRPMIARWPTRSWPCRGRRCRCLR